MEQLIFIGIILLFSMLEAVARKKKESGEGPAPEAPRQSLPEVVLPRRPEGRAPEVRVPSYDEDPSFDDAANAGSRGGPARVRPTSEGLIPADVWEEIQAMARGAPAPVRNAPPAPPAPAPRRAPAPTSARRTSRPPAPPMSLEARKGRPPAVPEVDVVVPEHAVHLTHAAYGKPVQDRLTGFDDTHKPRGLSVEAVALRRVLRGGGAPLRQAILLQEILGPPVSLKDDPSAG